MTEGHIARHRNYGLLMKRHRRDLRVRKLTIVLIYLLIIVAVMVLYIVVKREEQHRKDVPLHPSTAMVQIMRHQDITKPDPPVLRCAYLSSGAAAFCGHS
jgi:hypothetical protein